MSGSCAGVRVTNQKAVILIKYLCILLSFSLPLPLFVPHIRNIHHHRQKITSRWACSLLQALSHSCYFKIFLSSSIKLISSFGLVFEQQLYIVLKFEEIETLDKIHDTPRLWVMYYLKSDSHCSCMLRCAVRTAQCSPASHAHCQSLTACSSRHKYIFFSQFLHVSHEQTPTRFFRNATQTCRTFEVSVTGWHSHKLEFHV